MNVRLFSSLGALLAASLCAPAARATTTCTFSTVVGVAFGSYSVFAPSPLDSTGSFTYLCTGVGGSDTITINLSRGSASTFAPRQMLRLGTALTYNLYTDASRSTVWGDGTGGTSHYGPVTPPEGTGVTVQVYGRLFAGQSVPAGSYGDTVVVTVLF